MKTTITGTKRTFACDRAALEYWEHAARHGLTQATRAQAARFAAYYRELIGEARLT